MHIMNVSVGFHFQDFAVKRLDPTANPTCPGLVLRFGVGFASDQLSKQAYICKTIPCAWSKV